MKKEQETVGHISLKGFHPGSTKQLEWDSFPLSLLIGGPGNQTWDPQSESKAFDHLATGTGVKFQH